MDLSQLAGKIGLMSSGGGSSLFSPSFQSSNYEPTSKRKEFFSPDQPELFRCPKMARTEPPLYNTGWERITMNERMKLEELMRRVKGPFTPLQWMELEHQALIYKYLNAKALIPSSLLVSICKSLLDPSSTAPSLPYNTTGWFNFTNMNKKSWGGGEIEEGRCRRTDGKKWRCARNAVPEHKYCERHLIRNRHRSRKHVEQQQQQQLKHQEHLEQQKRQKFGQAQSVCSSDSSSAVLFSRTPINKEKSTITSLDFKQELPKYPSTLSYQQPISSNNTVNLNFSSSRSSYSKHNLSFSPAISLNCGGVETPSNSHLLQDFIGELTKIKPSQNKKSSQEFYFTQIGPLGEILGNSSSQWTI